jgi:hypothetical protein
MRVYTSSLKRSVGQLVDVLRDSSAEPWGKWSLVLRQQHSDEVSAGGGPGTLKSPPRVIEMKQKRGEGLTFTP